MNFETGKEIILREAQFLREIRNYFQQNSFIEVDTPFLVINPGLEPNLEYFHTEFVPSMDAHQKKETFFLPTSPEYSLKKVLALGIEKIFEIKHCFRNGENSPQHRPEFKMLEWYRSPGTYKNIADDFMGLATHLGKHFSAPKHWNNRIDLELTELFQEKAGISLNDMIEASSCPTQLKKFCQKNKIEEYQENDSFEDLFHKIFLSKIERDLPQEGFVFIWNYPKQLAALSQSHSENPNFCHRFEVYWQGIELGNCFDEECDPVKLRKKCEEDLEKRKHLQSAPYPQMDEDFIQAHEKISSAGGIAVGVDRLLMSLFQVKNIKEIDFFHS